MAAKVIVFSTPSCIWCKKVKEYLKSQDQSFTDIDVSKDVAARNDMIRKSGEEGVPQLWINNIPVVGYDREKIKRLLNLNNTKKGESNG
ncbi:MAG TPA: glutaredoxin domain-containing protein [Candidatus Cloacimonas sp.]|jgi:glutaredoxin-like YruB-family protein|nr:glutaredoxin domain-containing protein [Candidatus Cloacimonas sp.]HPS61200.1 glutaredoxin domain-containing protein [Candidatus Cloacimonas sp.]